MGEALPSPVVHQRQNVRDDESADTEGSFDGMLLRNMKKVRAAQIKASVKQSTQQLKKTTEECTSAMGKSTASMVEASNDGLEKVKLFSRHISSALGIVETLSQRSEQASARLSSNIERMETRTRDMYNSMRELDQAFRTAKGLPVAAFTLMVVAMICFAVFSYNQAPFFLWVGTLLIGLITGVYLCYLRLFV